VSPKKRRFKASSSLETGWMLRFRKCRLPYVSSRSVTLLSGQKKISNWLKHKSALKHETNAAQCRHGKTEEKKSRIFFSFFWLFVCEENNQNAVYNPHGYSFFFFLSLSFFVVKLRSLSPIFKLWITRDNSIVFQNLNLIRGKTGRWLTCLLISPFAYRGS